jgi:hypothetical protein
LNQLKHFQISDAFSSRPDSVKPTKPVKNDVSVQESHNVENVDKTGRVDLNELTSHVPVVGKGKHHESQPSMQGWSNFKLF